MTTTAITAGELRQFIERIEADEETKREAAEAQKETYAEAKARGYDVKIMRQVIARRKRDREELAEAEAILELYENALGGN